MLPRIVEFEVKAGNNHEAKIWIKRGLEGKLNAEYTNPTAKELFATVKNEHEAQLAAAKERREEAEREAKRLAAIEAAKPRPSRANYNKIQNGMSLAEAQQILGPGKEAAQAPGIQVVTWQSDDLLSTTIISITFENNQVQAKAIIGP